MATGPDGHPIPALQGVVDAKIQPIKLKKTVGEALATAKGAALDADGNPIDQTELLKLLGLAP